MEEPSNTKRAKNNNVKPIAIANIIFVVKAARKP